MSKYIALNSDEKEKKTTLILGIWEKFLESTKSGYIKEFGNAKYCDISITSDCIDHIILGPEFDDDSFKDISKIPNPKLSLPEIKTIPSIGTGVIRAK